MTKHIVLSLLLPLALVAVTTTAKADPLIIGPTPYLSFSDSPFSGGSFSYFHLEDFEDGALNTPGVSASAGIVVNPGAFTDSVDADDGSVDGSGNGGHSYYSNLAANTITFTFNLSALGTLPTHAGVVWTDVGFADPLLGIGSVTFEAFGPGGESLGTIGPFSLGDGEALGATAEDRFFGVVNRGGISAIKISTTNSTDWEVDHLQYGAAATAAPVPEPATVLLLCTGLVGLGGVIRRRHSRTG